MQTKNPIPIQPSPRTWVCSTDLLARLPLVVLLWSTSWLLTGCKRPYSSLVQESPALGSCYMLNTHVLTVESSEQSFKQFFTAHQAQDVWDWICLFRQYACLCHMNETILDADGKISNILSKREPKEQAALKAAIIAYIQRMNQETAFRDMLHANDLKAVWAKLNQAKGKDALDLEGMLEGFPEVLQSQVLEDLVPFIRTHCPKLVALNLSDNGLTTLPESFGDLTQLQILNLQFNRLTTLPESFRKLTKLQILDLYSNQLEALPNSFANLINLNELVLRDNDLVVLPNDFGNLTQLEKLDLHENHLEALPNTFEKLIKLYELDLGDNRLTELPATFANLTQLQILDLSYNQLEALPDTFGNLTQLQELDLSNNQLQILPASWQMLTNLQQFSVENNQLLPLNANTAHIESPLTASNVHKFCFPSLRELAGEIIVRNNISYNTECIPQDCINAIEYPKTYRVMLFITQLRNVTLSQPVPIITHCSYQEICDLPKSEKAVIFIKQ